MSKKPVFYNHVVDKGQLKKLVAWAYTHYGSAHCSQMADKLKQLGFHYATKAGVSISVDDLQVPPAKRQMLEAAESEIRSTESRYRSGEITEVERFQKVIDTWNGTSEALKEEVVRNFRVTNPLNSVYMMAFSGARGNLSQVRQLVGMRGLMADPQGEIIDLPIKTNFREGLTVTEYIISSYGARKGLVDTALRTADSGYLTRRLVDVSQDVIVREHDCGTQRGIWAESMTDGDRVLIPLEHRLLGRILARDVIHPKTKEVIYPRNTEIDATRAKVIGNTVEKVMVRSPLTCEAARSVCQCCYGWSLAHGHLVDMGEAVGIIAAQSIGEPGTQLTMRTFHTGGVFTGEVARQIRAPKAGTVKFDKSLKTRGVRTRHGDEREQVEIAGDLILDIPSNKKGKRFSLTVGSLLLVADGDKVEADQLLAEVAKAKVQQSTERATKDVSTDLAGEVMFADLVSEEKTDRQGNITTIAARGGLMWVLGGEVYNLLPGAEPVVKNGEQVHEGDVLAQTKLTSTQGGVVRLTPGSREIEIITASVQLDRSQVHLDRTGGREQLVIHTNNGDRFLLKTATETKVQNHDLIAELIDDRYQTETGGIIKYAGVEVAKRGKAKQGYEVIKGGSILWIPEECHEVNKDISLLLVEDGQYVEAGTEVVKDIYCQSAGIIEVVQKNDILREIVVKSGDLHLIDDLPPAEFDQNLIPPGSEVIPGVTTTELQYGEIVNTPEGIAILLRPVQEYKVEDKPTIPSQESINQSGKQSIELRSVQRLFYKDGERVKSVRPLSLMSTQLILEIEDNTSEEVEGNSNLSADIELIPLEDSGSEEVFNLQIVILESLVLRRDLEEPLSGGTKTQIVVTNGEEIPPDSVVARTEIHCKQSGEVRGIREGTEAIRRILVVRDSDRITINLDQTPKVKEGNLIVSGHELAEGMMASTSGQVVKVEDDSVTLRIARPYRVSPGAILQVDDGDLVQRGDNLVLLVFERSKTGDIIQGLPRIEELLEARKPKEASILARRPGIAQVVYEEGETVDVKIVEADGVVTDYPIAPGQNVLVTDEQKVAVGSSITDGPCNPHEILEVFFDSAYEEKGVYEGALFGLQNVQQFLVRQVQSVYQSQGIDISDKHIEVIVRQMTSKVRVDDGGDTTMLPGELVELRMIEQVNEAMAITGGAPARYTPVLLGITKASLNTDSFISAASFQETTRVLTEAAIEGKSDWLRGLKENVIIGRLIPAGTGFNSPDEMLTGSGDLDNGINGATLYPGLETGLGLGQTSENGDILDHASDFGEDVILDDRTARAYSLEEGADLSGSGRNALLDDDSE